MKNSSTTEAGQFRLPILGVNAEEIPAEALFDTWLQHQQPPMLPSTQRVYRTLWRRFIADLKLRRKSYAEVRAEDIRHFLAELHEVKRPQRERYQKVIARAYEELCRHDRRAENPAQASAINDPFKEDWRQAPDNQATQFLSVQARDHLIERILLRHRTLAMAADMTLAARWREYRDLAIVALMLGCGCRPVEVENLPPQALQAAQRRFTTATEAAAAQDETAQDLQAIWTDQHDWSDGSYLLRIEGVAAREIPVPAWCEPVLAAWANFKADHEAGMPAAMAPSQLLFPGTRRLSPQRPQPRMNPATLARIVSKWGLRHADLDMTPQRLRNSHGARLVVQGFSLPEIEHLMGYAEGAASAWRLQAAWAAWQMEDKLRDSAIRPIKEQ